MRTQWTVAGVQFDCQLGQARKNLATMLGATAELAARGAHLIVFPEAALSGYCYPSKAQALAHAETLPGPSTAAFAEVCARHDVHVIFGLLEVEGDDLYNAAALVGPNGLVASYRKTHLPYLGVDRFVTPGQRPFAVHDLGGLKVGMLICFDGSIPEAPRVLSLLGADLIVLPTNWPTGARCSAAHLAPMRAHENHVYFMAVNRVGTEGGFTFIGQSRVVDWDGTTLAQAGDGPGTFMATLEPAKARQKRVIFVPGEYELDRIHGRRPELYGPLVAAK